jgi:hypothetical protein
MKKIDEGTEEICVSVMNSVVPAKFRAQNHLNTRRNSSVSIAIGSGLDGRV